MTFSEIQELFLEVLNWYALCSIQIIVIVPDQDISTRKLVLQELKSALNIPIFLVPIEQLAQMLSV